MSDFLKVYFVKKSVLFSNIHLGCYKYCFIFTKIGTKLKLKINIGTKLSHFDTWHNCEVTRVKKKK